MKKIKIKVNGKFVEIDKNQVLSKLLSRLKIPLKKVAIELNQEIINKTSISNKEVESPIIGTAYLAPEPGGKKFIDIGKKIKKGDTVIIVEAMKTMNHIPSPFDGIVKEVCVEDGQPVEFGQKIAILE